MKSATLLPELGPALGRLVHPAESGNEVERLLAPVRLALVTRLLGAAGAARRALAEGDEAAAREALAPTVWAGLWDRAAEEATALVTERLDRRIEAAAAAARMPARRAARHRIAETEHRAIHARLGAGAGALLRAASELEPLRGDEWAARVPAAARRLESAWAALSAAAAREVEEWGPDIQAVAAWRPARWPVWAVTAAVLLAALWAGLVLGGYLPVPAALRPAAEFVWSRT